MVDQTRAQREVLTFLVGNHTYTIIASGHVLKRMEERGISIYSVISSCTFLGKKVEKYDNCGKSVMIVDKARKISILVIIKNKKIKLITALPETDVFVRRGTIKVYIK